MSPRELPPRWKKSDKSIRAIQVAFELGQSITETIRREASVNDLSPSDQIRKIIGLEVKPPKRPRLTVSLSQDDYQVLSRKFGIDPTDKRAIREAIRKALEDFARHIMP